MTCRTIFGSFLIFFLSIFRPTATERIRKTRVREEGTVLVDVSRARTGAEIARGATDVTGNTLSQEFLLFPNLSMLYLHANNVEDIVEVFKLRKLDRLRTLTLNKNPMCAACANYRSVVVYMVPGLQKLDNVVVVRSERSPSKSSLVTKSVRDRLSAAYPDDFVAPKQ